MFITKIRKVLQTVSTRAAFAWYASCIYVYEMWTLGKDRETFTHHWEHEHNTIVLFSSWEDL